MAPKLASAPRHLVLLTVDCLRADHLGAYGYSPSPTPFLDDLASTSCLFERAVTAGLPTYYAFPALLASRFPLTFGRNTVGLLAGEATLASALQAAGFDTAGFVATNPYVSAREGYHQGFEHFEDFLADNQEVSEQIHEPGSETLRHRLHHGIARVAGLSRPTEQLYQEFLFQLWALRFTRRPTSADRLRRYPAADRVVDAALPWLANRSHNKSSNPFFLWLHLMDPHHPYHPPNQALELLGRGDLRPERSLFLNALWSREGVSTQRRARYRKDLLALYDAGIRWVDLQVERLVQQLKEFELWNDTLLVLTADHGEEFLERGGRYHYPVQMGDEVTRVPLLLRDPTTPARRVPEAFSLLDLAPTLLHRLGLPLPPSFQGRSRWCEAGFVGSLEPVLTECVYERRNPWQPGDESGARLLAAQDGRYKLVVNFATGEEQFFDLVDDPQELTPWAHDRTHPARGTLLRAMREHVDHQRPDLRAESWRQAALSRLEHRLRREARRRAPAA